MEDLTVAAQEEAQGIETCMLIIAFTCLGGKNVEQRGLDEPYAAEVEVVADAAQMVVYDRMILAISLSSVPLQKIFIYSLLRILPCVSTSSYMFFDA